MNINPYTQNIVLSGGGLEKEKEYWLSKLEGGPEQTGILPGTPSPSCLNKRDQSSRAISAELAAKLMQMGNNSLYACYMILGAAAALLLSRYTASDDILTAMPILKNEKEGETLNNLLLLRFQIKADMSFKDLILEVKESVIQADLNSNFPLNALAELTDRGEWKGNNPYIKTLLLMEEIHDSSVLEHIDVDNIFLFSLNGGNLRLTLDYKSALYDKQTMEEVLCCYVNILESGLNDPLVKISSIEALSLTGIKQYLDTQAENGAQYPREKTIHKLFEEQVQRAPDNIALKCEGKTITYSQINEKADRLAYQLQNLGLKPGRIAGIMTDRSIMMITAMFAVLKAGGAYLPIDPDYPSERITYMLKDSGAIILLCDNDQFTADTANPLTIINLNDESLYTGVKTELQEINKPSDIAYVIYTSGTTGQSKGAMIEHLNVVRLMTNNKFQFDFSVKDVWTMFHSFCFDFSVWEIYGALLYGGTLVIVPKSVSRDPGAFLELLKENHVTVLNQTPAAFYNLISEEIIEPSNHLSLRYIIFGGEALKPGMLKEWKTKYPQTRLINMYGITETTVHVTYKEITDKEIEEGLSNIGKPIPTLTAYIMDKNLKLLPVGAKGELCVGGDGVCRGYLNRSELTREKFVNNPYNPGERLYRSGDLARLLVSGDMEYFGRMDFQVKIRGHRIELGEIETVSLQYPGITQTAALVRELKADKFICLYYVSASKISGEELKSFLAKKVPAYMIPSYFVWMEKLPMTANHKLDKKALPDPLDELGRDDDDQIPCNEMEERISGVWKEVLDLKNIGVTKDFFNLGGDSIKAITLISKINRIENTGLAIKDIYLNPSIRKLCEFIKTSMTESKDNDLKKGLLAIEAFKEKILNDETLAGKLPADFEDFYPLSPIQQGMVFFSKLKPDEPIYHDQFPYLVKFKQFEINVFNHAVKLLTGKHPILRTTFIEDEMTQPIQVVHRADSGIIPVICEQDISMLTKNEKQALISQYMIADLKNKFRFNNDPLCRLKVFGLGNSDYFIILSVQHAVLDGWSVALLMTDLFEILANLEKKNEFIPDNLKSSYKEYVAMSMVRKQPGAIKEFWKNFLSGYTRNKLPFSTPNTLLPVNTGSMIHRQELDGKLRAELTSFAEASGCTLQEICITAHVFLLYALTGEKDIVTGVVTHDRPAVEDSENVLGCFLNTIPIRITIDENQSKILFLDRVKKVLRNIKAHELFLADIALIAGETGNYGNPLFDTLHNFTDFHVLKSVKESSGDVITENSIEVNPSEMTNTLLDVEISATLDYLYLQVKYSPSHFLAEDIKTAANLYVRILEEFTKTGDDILDVEKLILPDEYNKMIYDFNNTDRPYANEKTIHGLFEEQTLKTPTNTALVLGEKQISYNELNEQSNRLAGHLAARGVKNNDLVALVTRRSFEMIIGMLAILKNGAAYVPIDPDYPEARKKYIASNSNVSAVLTDEESRIEHDNIIKISYDDFAHYPAENLKIHKDSKELAYVIYTSGSTGVPKGVMIEHHSAVNLVSSINRLFGVTENDTLLFITSMCFDLSVYDIFGILAAGGRIVIARKEQIQDPGELKKMLLDYSITFWDSVPSTMNLLTNTIEDTDNTYKNHILRLVFMSGDWIPVNLPPRLGKYFPDAKVISLGGATEGTVWSNYFPIPKDKEYKTSIPYGRPLDNNYFYILDERIKPVPQGVTGELYIGGAGVARGYMNDEEKTKAAFVKNRFIRSGFDRMYRTGDLGRMLPDNNIEFLGRRDSQVKIRGYRIELGEIENDLLKHEKIKEAVVTARSDKKGNKYLCAYIVSDYEFTVQELRKFLSYHLADYMIPSHFMKIKAIPLSANGKIDKSKLPDPDESMKSAGEYVPPQNIVEKQLSGIWAEVLGAGRVGMNDDFFDLGGNSIKAIEVIAKTNQNNLNIELIQIMNERTIRNIVKPCGQPGAAGEDFFTKNIKPQVLALHREKKFEMINGAGRKGYNTGFKPQEYPYYYPAESAVICEAALYKNICELIERSFLPVFSGAALPGIGLINNVENSLKTFYNVPGEQLYPDALIDFFKVKPVVHNFLTPIDAVSCCIQCIEKDEVAAVDLSSYYLKYSDDYLFDETALIDRLNRDKDKAIALNKKSESSIHRILVIDETENGYIIFDPSYMYYGEITKDEFIKALSGCKNIKPHNNSAEQYKVFQYNCEKSQSFDWKQLGTGLLEKNTDDHLCAADMEFTRDSKDVKIFFGIKAVRALAAGLSNPAVISIEYQIPELAKIFSCWAQSFALLRNFLVTMNKYHTIPATLTSFFNDQVQLYYNFGKEINRAGNDPSLLSVITSGLLDSAENLERIFTKIKEYALILKRSAAGEHLPENWLPGKSLDSFFKTEREKDKEITIVTTQESETVPSQEHIFREEKNFNIHHWNVGILLFNSSGYNESYIVKVFNAIMKEHDSLRVVFIKHGQEVRQLFKEYADNLFEYKAVDLKNESSYEPHITAEMNKVYESIDLYRGPLVKLRLFHTSNGDYLALCLHHLICDFYSLRIIIEDLETGYRQLLNNENIGFNRKTMPFKDWSQLVRQNIKAVDLKEELNFWKSKTFFKPPCLPEDRAVVQEKAKDSQSCFMELPLEESKLLYYDVTKKLKVSIQILLLGILGLAVRDWNSSTKFRIQVVNDGRNLALNKKADVSRTVGWFSLSFPVVMDVSNDLQTFFHSLNTEIIDSQKHGPAYKMLELYFDRIESVIDMYPEHNIQYNYLGRFTSETDVIFNAVNMEMGDAVGPESKRFTPLEVNASIANDIIMILFSYNKHQFTKENFARFTRLYQKNVSFVIDEAARI